MDNEVDLQPLRTLLPSAFNRPRFHTRRYWNLWAMLEAISDGLAGPLSSIAHRGNCDYLFSEQRIAGVRNPDDLVSWLLDLVAEYRQEVLNEEPHTDPERADQELLLAKAAAMEQLTYLASHIISPKR